MALPKDPFMLLSFVNTQLRDNYSGLKELAAAYDIDEKELCDKLAQIDYKYDETVNQFKQIFSIHIKSDGRIR